MEFVRTVCPTCGGRLTADPANRIAVCAVCGNSYVVKIAEKIAEKPEESTRELKNLRTRLDDAVAVNDLKNVSAAAGKILELIPEDFTARYFFAYAENGFGKHSYLEDFYAGEAGERTPEDLRLVLDHINAYGDLRDRVAIEGFLMSLEDVDAVAAAEAYKSAFLKRKALEENYDDVPRDVFICHRSSDGAVAKTVLEALERDGWKCWISTRNLRPNDSENYWDNIRKAITSCKLFLAVVSESAMLSNDVKSELNIAKSLAKPRLEYKIDDAEHTTLFKSFFDGLMWVPGFEGDRKRSLVALCSRVYEELEKADKQDAPDKLEELKRLIQSQKPVSMASATVAQNGGAALEALLKRAKMEVEDGAFEEAAATCDKIADLDAENPDLWFCRLLIEGRATRYEDLNRNRNAWISIDGRNMKNFVKFNDREIVSKATDTIHRRIASRLANTIKKASADLQAKLEAENKEKRKKALLREVEIEGKTLKKYSGSARLLDLSDLEEDLTSIGYSAFSSCRSLTSIVIPNSVTSIGASAFKGCSSLTSMVIPNSVTYISDDAFSGCSSLTSITIGNGVTSIGTNAFEGCDLLNKVEISDVGAWCRIKFGNIYSNPLFYAHHLYVNGAEVTELVIPNSVTSIGDYAFSGCSSLTSMVIPNSVTSIGSYVFSYCSSLTSMVIPNRVTSIGDHAFFGCSSLTSIEIPNSVTSIGDYAFSFCSSLTSIVIPNSVTIIGNEAFFGCYISNIEYKGTKSEWRSIEKRKTWKHSTGDFTVKCTNGELPKWRS